MYTESSPAQTAKRLSRQTLGGLMVEEDVSMNKSRSWFAISLLLLAGCIPGINPSPTASLPVESTVPTKIPSTTPTDAPEESPNLPVWDLQIRITTTSDWTRVSLEGVIVDDYSIVSASQSAETASFDVDSFNLTQPIEQANSGMSVELVVKLSLDNEFGGIGRDIQLCLPATRQSGNLHLGWDSTIGR
jgi:hypothetical protein